MKDKLLCISNLLPFPLDNGGKIKTFNTLKILSQIYEITLLCFIEEKTSKNHIENLEVLGIKVKVVVKTLRQKSSILVFMLEVLKSIFSRYPYVVSKFRNKEMYKLSSIEIEKNPAIILIDHLALMPYVEKNLKKNKNCQIFLDQHNVENQIIKRRLWSSKNPISFIFLSIELIKLRFYEKWACLNVRKVFAISDQDKNEFMKLCGNRAKIEVSPIFIESHWFKTYEYTHNKKNILFIGTMSWYPNVEGIIWFIKNVFNAYDLNQKGWKLFVVGGSPPEKLIKYSDNENIIITGYVEDIRPYFEEAMLSVVPLKIGGGIRIKILELLSFGIPIISTEIGCEGIPYTDNQNICIANDPSTFLKYLNKINDEIQFRKLISEKSIELMNDKYAANQVLDKYRALFST